MKQTIPTILCLLLAVPLFGAGEFSKKGSDYGASRVSYAVIPAGSKPRVTYANVTADTNAATLTFFTAADGVLLAAAEGVAGTCSVANASYGLTNGDSVVSRDVSSEAYELHSVAAAETNYVVLSPAPSAALVAGDILYEVAADIVLPCGSESNEVRHVAIGPGLLAVGQAQKPMLVELTGHTNSVANLNVVSGERE